MNTFKRFVPGLFVLLSVTCFGYSVALAGGPTPSVAASGNVPMNVALWGVAALIIAQVSTLITKKLSTWWFFHTVLGTVVLSAVSAVLGAAGPVIAQKGFDKWALIGASLNAVLNVLVTFNATNATALEAVKARRVAKSSASGAAARQAGLMLMLLVLFVHVGLA